MYEISEKQVMKKQQNNCDLTKSIMRAKREGDADMRSVGSEIRPEGVEEPKKRVKLNLGPEHLKELMLLVWWVEPLQVEHLEE